LAMLPVEASPDVVGVEAEALAARAAEVAGLLLSGLQGTVHVEGVRRVVADTGELELLGALVVGHRGRLGLDHPFAGLGEPLLGLAAGGADRVAHGVGRGGHVVPLPVCAGAFPLLHVSTLASPPQRRQARSCANFLHQQPRPQEGATYTLTSKTSSRTLSWIGR